MDRGHFVEGCMTDRELIEALYQRIEAGAIRLDLLSLGDVPHSGKSRRC